MIALKRKLSFSSDGKAILVRSTPTTIAVPTAPTTALQTTSAGVCTAGAHTCAITYVCPQGETTIGTSGTARTVDGTHNKIDLTLIPVDPYGLATARNVYMSKAGTTTPLYFVGQIADNITRDYTVDIADENLAIASPAANTAITGALRAPTAPTTALITIGTGLCTDGAHTIAVTYVTPQGEGCLGVLATARTTSSTQNKIRVTAIPVDATGYATGRNIYMTKAGTTWPFYKVVEIADNTTVQYDVDIADASLTVSPPTVPPHGATQLHTAVSGQTAGTFDEVWLWAYNGNTTDVVLTLEWGAGVVPNDVIVQTIPFKKGMFLVLPGFVLQNGLVIRAFAATTKVISITGFVNRLADA